MSSLYRQQLESWLKTLHVKADSVLDVGGSALPVKDRVASWEVGYYALADNYTERARQLADLEFDINHLLVGEVMIKTTEAFHKFVVKDRQCFDVVFCLEVMEYVWNPMDALLNLNLFTKKGGTVYITFPFVYPVHNPIESDYLRYTEQGARKLLKENGFRVVRCIPRVDTTNTLPAAFAANRMHAAKGIAHNTLGVIVEAVVENKASFKDFKSHELAPKS